MRSKLIAAGGVVSLMLSPTLPSAAQTAAPPPVGRPTATAKPKPWWTHAVIYEIYPRSFQDTDGDGIGDLKGITARLDYLQSLGIDAIWITPFFKSPNADFGYDVSDYTAIDPAYGTMADWDRLVAEARRRGIRVLVDFVVNHTSSAHPWFIESRRSRSNPKADWYVWHDGKQGVPPTNWQSIFGGSTWTWDPARQQYYYHIFLPEQPDVNWRNPGLRKAMFDVVRFWLDHGAAGFRLDATPYLMEDTSWPQDPSINDGKPVWLKPYNSQLPGTNEVLREMRTIVDSYPGDPVLLGEASTLSIDELRAVYGKNRDEIHLPMNFLIGNLTKLDAGEFKRRYDEAATKLDGLTSVDFFSSHDHVRQWSLFGDGAHNDLIAKMTGALNLLNPGTALIYYGEEIGMGTTPRSELNAAPIGPKRPRADDRDGARTPMQWDGQANAGFTTGTAWLSVDARYPARNVRAEEGASGSILGWYRYLTGLRRNDPAFRDGTYVPLESGDAKVFAFARQNADGTGAMVAINTGTAPATITTTGWTLGKPTFVSRTCASGNHTVSAPLAPFDTCIDHYRQ